MRLKVRPCPWMDGPDFIPCEPLSLQLVQWQLLSISSLGWDSAWLQPLLHSGSVWSLSRLRLMRQEGVIVAHSLPSRTLPLLTARDCAAVRPACDLVTRPFFIAGHKRTGGLPTCVLAVPGLCFFPFGFRSFVAIVGHGMPLMPPF